MTQSEQIGELAAALSKAQGEMNNAVKDKSNPFFKSKYADLANVWDACREPLSKNGLSVTQTIDYDSGSMFIITTLMHSSGQWMNSKMPVITQKNDPQGITGAITYFKRCMLSALVGVATEDEDDDGESCTKRESMQQNGGGYPPKTISEPQAKFLIGTLKGDPAKMKALIDYCHKNFNIFKIEDIQMSSFNSVLEFAKSLGAQ